MERWRILQLGGGRVAEGDPLRLMLPATTAAAATTYSDAQIDDYGGRRRANYPWQPGARLRLQACFSHGADALVGTAGFGFWNAPFGDPTVRWPALPQATWFFYGSPPTDLPLAPAGPGRGWFAATLDAGSWPARAVAPLALPVLLLNQIRPLRRRIWPWVQRRLGISYRPLTATMTEWHQYELIWSRAGCRFLVDGAVQLQTPFAPRGPLGFVCWIDNQFMVARADGRWRWGVLSVPQEQWLAVRNLQVERIDPLS